MTTFDNALIGVYGLMGTQITLKSMADSAYDISTGKVARTATPVTCYAQVRGYQASEIGGTIEQGDRQVTVLATSLNGVVPTVKDKLTFAGIDFSIISVQDGDEVGRTSAYVIQARG